jgi:hypothetical protein
VPLRELPRKTANAFPALLMPVILLYGIYGGVTTPTEAAAIAALYALLLAGLFYRALSCGRSTRSSSKAPVLGGRGHGDRRRADPELHRRQENIPGMVADALVGSTCTRWCSC